MEKPETLSAGLRALSWVLRVGAAGILAQTLYFKFTGAPESVYIFTTVGQEPWGRYGAGATELVAAVLLLMPRTVALGAALSAGVMTGAILFHLTKLGIVVMDDGGLLFGLAVGVWTAALVLLVIHRRELPVVGARLS